MNSDTAEEWGIKIMISCFPAADNGPCIGEKYYKKIFHIFQRLRPRDKVESAGVGLTIVPKIVEMRGEAIRRS
jgi:light-regulated signal transduction histidine kinase (bacteriophytochrome)